MTSSDQTTLQKVQNLLLRGLNFHPQQLLLLPAVHRKHAVTRSSRKRLLKMIIHLVDGALLRLFPLRAEFSPLLRHPAHIAPHRLRIGEALRQNITGPRNRLLCAVHTLLRRDIGVRLLLKTPLCPLRPYDIRKSREPALCRCRSSRAPLWAIGAVNVVKRNCGLCREYCLSQLLRELSLLLDGKQYLLPPLLQIFKCRETLRQRTQLLIVQCARRFLSVSRDKGNRTALIDQTHCGIYLREPDTELLRYFFIDLQTKPPLHMQLFFSLLRSQLSPDAPCLTAILADDAEIGEYFSQAGRKK